MPISIIGKQSAFQETDTDSLTSFAADLGQITSAIQNLESRYKDRFEKAVVELRETLRTEIREELRKEYDHELQEGIDIARHELGKRLESATAEWDAERKRLRTELHNLSTFCTKLDDLREEIRRSEGEIGRIGGELQAMIDDPDIELYKLIRARAELTENQNYIKGLRFLLPDARSAQPAR